MKIVLAAVNAKYIHSNLAVYTLSAYAKAKGAQVEIAEYTINQQKDEILKSLFRKRPDVLCISCYIWNISYVEALVTEISKILPRTELWLGGPEVSFRAVQMLEKHPCLRGIMKGEGEKTFAELALSYQETESGEKISENGMPINDSDVPENRKFFEKMTGMPGITWRDADGAIHENPWREVMDLSEVPFPYENLEDFSNRIIYYESSRGCPFSCSYCLSSIDKRLRFRSMELVKKELQFFLDHEVPQVKFVDRTFNCRKDHAMEIWKYLAEHDNQKTNFHFEIAADLITPEELELFRRMRPGLIQLEIGVQSTNLDTIREIHRKMDFEKVSFVVREIQKGRNIHQHLDLIAGLPFEDFSSFLRSFDEVYRMGPDQLQLGFLKVLKGSFLAENQEQYGLKCRRTPPYEVMSTKWLSYGEVLRLKAMEEMLEVYGNSGQFRAALRLLEREAGRPSELFLKLADYYEREGLFGRNIARLERYEIFYRFLEEFLEEDVKREEKLSAFRDRLVFDLYLRENAKSRPSFALDQTPAKKRIREFFIGEEQKPRWLLGYEGYDSRQIAKMAHLEAMEDGTFLLFDYRNRDPKDHNGRARRLIFKEQDSEWTEIPLWESQEEGVL